MVERESGGFLDFLSGEWMLAYFKQGNGGGAVIARALQVTITIYVCAILLRAFFTPNTGWEVDHEAFDALVIDTIPWFGAIFAATYAAFYARFSSQWNYLANLYNQIMAAKTVATDTRSASFVKWQAAFIEDAQDLHLAAKPMFASVIHFMLEDPDIKAAFIRYSFGGEKRLQQLRPLIDASMKATMAKYGADASVDQKPSTDIHQPEPTGSAQSPVAPSSQSPSEPLIKAACGYCQGQMSSTPSSEVR